MASHAPISSLRIGLGCSDCIDPDTSLGSGEVGVSRCRKDSRAEPCTVWVEVPEGTRTAVCVCALAKSKRPVVSLGLEFSVSMTRKP